MFSKSSDKLLNALYFTLDLFSRPNMPFFLLEDTAEDVYKRKKLSGNKITVGIRKVEANKTSFSIMDSFYAPEYRREDEIRYSYDGVPVIVKIIDSTDPMFTTLDTFLYQYEFFSVPNPMRDYLKIKDTLYTSYGKTPEKSGRENAESQTATPAVQA